MSDTLELVARAVSLNLKSQWEGQEIVKELNDPTSWSAEGGEIDLTKLAQAAIDVHLQCLIEKASDDLHKHNDLSHDILIWLKAQKNGNTA